MVHSIGLYEFVFYMKNIIKQTDIFNRRYMGIIRYPYENS